MTTLKVLITFGGALGKGISDSVFPMYDLVIVSDASAEISDHLPSNAISIPLGTIKKRVAQAHYLAQTGEKDELYRRIGLAASLRQGMAAMPGLGEVVAMHEPLNPYMDEISESLRALLGAQTYTQVALDVGFSICGGAGAGSVIHLTEMIVQTIQKIGATDIQIVFNTIGSGTFNIEDATLHIAQNAAMVGLALIDKLSDPTYLGEDVSKIAHFTELPQAGNDGDLRAKFGRAFLQGLFSEYMAHYRASRYTNDAARTPKGLPAGYTIQPAMYFPEVTLDPSKAGAQHYMNLLNAELASQSILPGSLNVNLPIETVPPQFKKAAQAASKGKAFFSTQDARDEFLTVQVTAAAEDYQFLVDISGNSLTFKQFLSKRDGSIRYVSYFKRLRELFTVKALLESAIAERNALVSSSKETAEENKRMLETALKSLFPLEFWMEGITTFFTNTFGGKKGKQERVDTLHKQGLAGNLYTEAEVAMQKALLENPILEDALNDLNTALLRHQSKLTGLLAILKQLTPIGHVNDDFAFNALELVFDRFIIAPDADSVQEVLYDCVKGLSPTGLASLLGASSTDPTELARKLLNLNYQHKAIQWANGEVIANPKHVLIIPWVEDTLFEDIKQSAESGSGKLELTRTTHTLEVCVVSLKIVKVEHLITVVTSTLAHAAIEVCRRGNFALHSTSATPTPNEIIQLFKNDPTISPTIDWTDPYIAKTLQGS